MAIVLDKFEKGYQKYNGLSDGRRDEQQTEIRRLAEFAEKPAEQCTAADLRDYLSSLHLHVNTVRKRLHLLRPFFTWGYENGLVTADQLMGIKLVKAPKGSTSQGTPRPYSSKELRRFWEEFEAQWPAPARFDYYLQRFQRGTSRYAKVAPMVMRLQTDAIITLALECGLRRIEIFNAEIDHIHPDNATVIVPQRGDVANGKDHYREVPHTEQSRRVIQAWLELRAAIGVDHDRPWIIGAANQAPAHALSPITLKSFENVPTQVGSWEYHRFRHTCATLWVRAGMPIEQVQKLLGHSKLQQTLAYAEIVTEDIRRSVNEHEAKFTQLTRRQR